MLNRLLYVITALFLLAGLMSLFSDAGWLFDLASHFPVQSVLALLPLSLLAIARKLRVALVLLIAALTFNIATLAKTEWLADRDHLVADAQPGGTPYRLMTLNVLIGNNEYAQISRLITEHLPDAVLILELTPQLKDYLSIHLADYPYFFGLPIKRAAGIGVFTRMPMQNTAVLALGNQYAPAVYIEQPLSVKSSQDTASVRLIGIHPNAPIAPDMYEMRNYQLRTLTTEVAKFERPLVIAGDFNITPWSNDFRSLLKVGQLTDSRVGFGIQGTWPSCLPLLSIPIDHVLTSPGITVKDRRVVHIEGSDHCGVVAELLIR